MMDRRALRAIPSANFALILCLLVIVAAVASCVGCGRKEPASRAGKLDTKTIEEFSKACVDGDIEQVSAALNETPALAKARNRDGYTPLHLAVSKCRAEIVHMLIEKGADVNAAGKDGLTPLHVASALGHPTMAKILLDAGAEIDALDANKWTPLHYSAMGGHADTARFLVEHGARTDLRNLKGLTALDLAEKLGHRKVVSLLKSDSGNG